MASKTSNLVSPLLSLFSLLLFVSSQLGFSEAQRVPSKKSPSLPIRPPPPRLYVPPSRSRRGSGP